ncbi:sodium-dependent neutral amino acid transporter B(0)AT3 isoform X1 [Callorhinchus milii]|uniref:Transporter n=1 Tax=Callorhinchus milii TaxID=7868 RepID=A0A4W3JXB1_CALMI|nr:sodium-dependent neutral amino acid transporter B(0)AT3 isoform X1 [Callorhinchus milii]|eukprot:gi/632945019/ref/XP_007887826.1/ PREDICTED: sodium-dependent neutral amino acid transporter B(0)AT3 isoform X1 [Callorhinchus milii]
MAIDKATVSVVSNAGNEQEEDRPKWDNKFQYLLTCAGFAVGLGNIWRFPYLCQTYGGGAFLIPYSLALIFVGIPLFHLELAIGQRLRKGSIGVWNSISPYLGGVGIASMLVSFLMGLYYNTILAWVLWYFFHSFQDPLPWKNCPKLNDNQTECEQSTPVDYFWYRKTLNISNDINVSGELQWWLVICLATAWIIVFMCTIKGIESIGKAVYITSTFPYLILLIFFVRGLTLPGAIYGLNYLFTPDLTVLAQPKVWLDAATQIYFSLSLGFGGFIAFSSYNPPKNDCEADAVGVAILNSITSLFASIPLFSILGFKANVAYCSCLDKNVLLITNEFDIQDGSITRDNYASWLDNLNDTHHDKISNLDLKNCDLKDFLDQSASGTGLAFIIFTEAIIQMPGSQVWSILFFIMLFSLGLSSMFGNIEGVVAPLLDLKLLPKYIPKEVITGIICMVSFVIALTFTLASGNYWFEIFDTFAVSLPLLIIAFFEFIGVAYVYGMDKFGDDFKFMTGRRLNLYWRLTWKYISPLTMVLVFMAFLIKQVQVALSYEAWNPNYDEFPQKEVKEYKSWVVFFCVILAALPAISILVTALYHLFRSKFKATRGELKITFHNEAFEQ